MHYMIGEIVEGVVTGIKPYGAFVSLDTSHNGLIHISEISERFVKDVHYYVRINQRVKVKILDIDDETNHFKLSLKAAASKPERITGKRHIVHELPDNKLGFSTLADKLNFWIKEAIK